MSDRVTRAARHAALGDPMRLAIVDALAGSDMAPVELRRLTGLESNLLAHHLAVLEDVGLILRSASSGDGRRRYVRLLQAELPSATSAPTLTAGPALFICSANSARSQLAAALWREVTGAPADSAGTVPTEQVHPGAVAAAQRVGLDLCDAVPRLLDPQELLPSLVVTVCDRAHEELSPETGWRHWSTPDPVETASAVAFDEVVVSLRDRIERGLDRTRVAS